MNLKRVTFTDSCVLDEAEIQTIDPVCTQDIAANVSNWVGSRNAAEQRPASRRLNVPHRHLRQIEIRVQEGTDRCADQVSSNDPARSAHVQACERRARLQGEKTVNLPASENLAQHAPLAPHHGQFKYTIDGEPVRAIIR